MQRAGVKMFWDKPFDDAHFDKLSAGVAGNKNGLIYVIILVILYV